MSGKLARKKLGFFGTGSIQLWCILIMLNLASSIDILIVQNDKSKDSQIWSEEIKNEFESVIDFHQCSYSNISECINTYPETLAILDISNDFAIQLSLSQLCKENKKIHLVTQQRYEYSYNDKWTYSILPSNSAEMEAYFAVLDHFNWTKGIVINDEENINVKQKFIDYSDQFVYFTIDSSANIENFVGQIIKPLGARLYYIFANSVLSLKIQEALESKKLLLNGDGIILNQNSSYDCAIDGAIIITVAGQEYANSQEDVLLNLTQNLLQYLINATAEPTKVEELIYLLKEYNDKSEFSILNIKAGEREVFGSISGGKVQILKNLTFPGNNSDTPKSEKKILHVTVSAATYNPDVPPNYYGAYTAWTLINDGELGILNNFQIAHYSFDCGGYTFNETYTTACLKKELDKFGLMHISAITSSATIGELKIFKSLNLTIPTIGAAPRDDSLSSTESYPLFARINASSQYSLSLASLLFKALGWKKICVLYLNDTTSKSIYSVFLKSAEYYGLEILNPESSRMINAESNRTKEKKYFNQLQTIIDTQARFLVLPIPPPYVYYVLEELYDMGIRKGDLFTYAITSWYLSLTGYDSLHTYKIKESGFPMIAIEVPNWIGEAGQLAYSKISSLYNIVPLAYACLTYDAAYLIANALDSIINQGLDYYDPYQINTTMREQKFVGCTGTFYMDKNSNDRILDAFDVLCNKINITSGNFIVYKVGKFHPYSSTLLAIESPIIYGDGTTIKPDDLRNQDNECPFPDKLIKTFAKGRILTFGICFGFALISVALTVFIWKTWWNIATVELKQKHEISLQDFIVEVSIGIEFFQYANMGPDITSINNFLAKASYYFSFSLENIWMLRNGLFWLVMDAVYGAIILWLILCLTILLRLDEKFPRFSIFRIFAWLADYLMPILGNLCFIPFVSMCLNVFVCDHSIGDNFTDSFLSQDCYYFCWKDEHLIYAIFSFIALLCYIPLSVFCRPLWQELHQSVHIHAAPLFLMVKTIVQILLVVMNKTVKRADATIHEALFAILIAGYIAFIFKFKPYNYPRLSWWQGLSLIGVLWLSVLSTISSNVEGNRLIYFISLCIGWIIIGIVGIYVQRKKYPSLLYSKKGLDTTTLYKFAFAFGKHSKIALSKIAPNQASKDSISRDFHL